MRHLKCSQCGDAFISHIVDFLWCVLSPFHPVLGSLGRCLTVLAGQDGLAILKHGGDFAILSCLLWLL